jgi:YesN/AraC family two-component response regulator
MLKENQIYKILVVEDNLGDFVLVEEYISDIFLNAEIINVANYKELVAIVSTDAIFDIVFLDLTLPDKNGIDLVKSCVNFIDFAPIVVLTGYPDFNFAVESLSLGVSDYLLKEDLNPNALHKCIIYNIERYKNVLKVKNSEQYYLDLFQLSPNPLFVYDQSSNLILDVNDAAITNYQFSLQEFLEKNIEDLNVEKNILSEFDEDVFVEFDENQPTSKNNPKFQIGNITCHQKKNGELLYVLSRKNRVVYKGIDAVILSVEDLTKEILHIQSIQTQNKKLKEIAWIQSHIVRAPLARIMGLITLLSDEMCNAPEQKAIYKMVIDSSLELDNVIKDIVIKTNEI